MSESTDLTTVNAKELEALQAAQDQEFDQSDFQTPILKIGQPLTREVQDELAEPGEFINTLTGDGLGDKIEFIIAAYQKGRFAADRESGRAYVAFGDRIPDAWEDLVGSEFVGTLFSEYPDAEETYKVRVNNKEIDWGKGPLVSTTHNYTGLVVVPAIEGSDEEPELQPVRLSLQRTNMPAVRKINSLKRMSLRNKAFWDKAFDLSTYKKSFAQGVAFNLNAKLGRDTTPEERGMAAELAQAAFAGRVRANDDGAADAPVEPSAKGGLEV